MSAILIGIAAGVLCYLGVLMKVRLGYDDSLDVVGVHGVGGILGALATGLLAQTAINAAGADGALFGNPILLVKQVVAVVAVVAWSFALSYGLLRAIEAVMGLRVDADEEEIGLDLSQHNETAYVFGSSERPDTPRRAGGRLRWPWSRARRAEKQRARGGKGCGPTSPAPPVLADDRASRSRSVTGIAPAEMRPQKERYTTAVYASTMGTPTRR